MPTSRLNVGHTSSTISTMSHPGGGPTITSAGHPSDEEILRFQNAEQWMREELYADGAKGKPVPQGNGVAVPQANGVAVPQGNGVAVPQGNGVAVPQGNGVASVPSKNTSPKDSHPAPASSAKTIGKPTSPR